MSTEHAIAQLRHLYSQMVGGYVRYPAEAARGLLGPAIAELERLLLSAERAEAAEGLARALERVTNGMDASGGDGRGMPECPWCHSDGSYHDADCEPVAARSALAAWRSRGGGGTTP